MRLLANQAWMGRFLDALLFDMADFNTTLKSEWSRYSLPLGARSLASNYATQANLAQRLVYRTRRSQGA